MRSWIIGISGDFEQHWEIAEQEKLWDTVDFKQIRRGDRLHFWLTGKKRLLGSAVAASDMHKLRPGASRPWEDSPIDRTYKYRVDLHDFRHIIRPSPDIGELRRLIGRGDDARNWPAEILRSDGDERLLALYDTGSSVENSLVEQWLEAMRRDERASAMQLVRLRQGQRGFRSALINAYNGRCLVSGCATEVLLDAAHIMPYRGKHTNSTSNGLLLRTDIHTLFDAHLLAIDSKGVVRLSPTVRDDEYRRYHGKKVRRPSIPGNAPDKRALAAHASECGWLWLPPRD